MKKIPYGIINYQTLIEQGYYYIDKTMYLEKLERVGKTLFYLRPGRFGKSLFTSMMYYYYDVKSADLFESLFKDTYVYQNPTPEKNSYYVLKFDFSGISSAEKNMEELETEFKGKVKYAISSFNTHYNLNIKVSEEESVNQMLLHFLSQFESLQLEHKLYILIDEYDNFTNAILEGDALRFKSIVGNEGVIKAFYAAIKEYIGLGVIERFFATGICPITLDSMTTGFNIASDISNHLSFNSMIGLTHEEVKNLLKDAVEEKDREEVYELMIENYDGYLFHKDAKEKVFNATLVMYLLNYYEEFQSIPENLMDKNIVSNYGKIENLLKLQDNAYYEEILEQLLKEGSIVGELINNFNLLVPFTENDIISLLYYFGYLTICNYDFILNEYKFQIPNKIMKEAYNNYFIFLLSQLSISFSDEDKRNGLQEMFYEGKLEKITNYISHLLKECDNRIFMKFDEKYIALMYYIILRHPFLNLYNEYPCQNGYIDMYIETQNEICKYNFIIELKYIKKKEYNEALLKEKIKEAKSQIENYGKEERLHHPLKKYIIVFSGSTCLHIESVE